jgi:hypothetical protein
MSQLAPPKPPLGVAMGDDDRLQRLRFRLWQVMLAIVTVVATVWVLMLGIPLLSITAVVVAKHVLVAILVMGLHVYPGHVEK